MEGIITMGLVFIFFLCLIPIVLIGGLINTISSAREKKRRSRGKWYYSPRERRRDLAERALHEAGVDIE